MASVSQKAADRGAKGYIVIGNSDGYQAVLGEPGGEVYESRVASSVSEAEKLIGQMVDSHYPAKPKADSDEDDGPKLIDENEPALGSAEKRDDGLTGDPREGSARDTPATAQPTDNEGRPSGSTDAASEKAAKKSAGKAAK